jgi:hypothetical protein
LHTEFLGQAGQHPEGSARFCDILSDDENTWIPAHFLRKRLADGFGKG